ncbi:hypothetical protein A2U01_0097807, partial [Trifolium medium]|nr:hypothetical protein [Trifolium medium]
ASPGFEACNCWKSSGEIPMSVDNFVVEEVTTGMLEPPVPVGMLEVDSDSSKVAFEISL